MSKHSDFDDILDEETEPLSLKEWMMDIFKTWGPAIFTVLLIRSAIAEPFRIPSGSMTPTLAIGDHILVTKYTYGLRFPLTRIPVGSLKTPERGDVIVFVFPESDADSNSYWVDMPFPGLATLDYVKRVVALPGERVKVKNNNVYINGKVQTQKTKGLFPFVDDRCRSHKTREHTEALEGYPHSILTAYEYGRKAPDSEERIVPKDHVFVMGDNRDHSSDSRVWGFVPLRNIKGKARFIWLSYDQCTPGIPVLGSIRNERFGIPIE
jgi:signal peptidase I